MKCPDCGTDGAYHGFSVIECANKKCKHYKARDKDETKSETKIVFDSVEVEPEILIDLGLVDNDLP